jgi:pentapeptide MXKDX repeat protein
MWVFFKHKCYFEKKLSELWLKKRHFSPNFVPKYLKIITSVRVHQFPFLLSTFIKVVKKTVTYSFRHGMLTAGKLLTRQLSSTLLFQRQTVRRGQYSKHVYQQHVYQQHIYQRHVYQQPVYQQHVSRQYICTYTICLLTIYLSTQCLSVDTMSVDTMSVDTMSVDTMSVDTMSVDNMSVDNMSVDNMSVDNISVFNVTFLCCRQCVCRQYDIFLMSANWMSALKRGQYICTSFRVLGDHFSARKLLILLLYPYIIMYLILYRPPYIRNI